MNFRCWLSFYPKNPQIELDGHSAFGLQYDGKAKMSALIGP